MSEEQQVVKGWDIDIDTDILLVSGPVGTRGSFYRRPQRNVEFLKGRDYGSASIHLSLWCPQHPWG